jgi:hypothetical protein
MFFRLDRKNKEKRQIVYSEKIEYTKLELTSTNVKKLIQYSDDVIFRELYINGDKNLPITMVFIDGLVDIRSVDENILKPLVQEMNARMRTSEYDHKDVRRREYDTGKGAR